LFGSFVTVAVNDWVVPPGTGAVGGATATATGGKTVIVAEPDLVGSATDVAVRVTVLGVGTAAGAVYVVGAPLAVLVGAIVPHPGEQAIPPCVRVQVTPLLLASFRTVGINCCDRPTGTEALPGATETVMAGTVIVAELDLVESATEVALTVTVRVLAGGPGAV